MKRFLYIEILIRTAKNSIVIHHHARLFAAVSRLPSSFFSNAQVA